MFCVLYQLCFYFSLKKPLSLSFSLSLYLFREKKVSNRTDRLNKKSWGKKGEKLTTSIETNTRTRTLFPHKTFFSLPCLPSIYLSTVHCTTEYGTHTHKTRDGKVSLYAFRVNHFVDMVNCLALRNYACIRKRIYVICEVQYSTLCGKCKFARFLFFELSSRARFPTIINALAAACSYNGNNGCNLWVALRT